MPKFLALPDTEKRSRYNQYVVNFTRTNAGNPKYSKEVLPSTGRPHKGKSRGKSVAKALAETLGFQLSPPVHDFLTARVNPFCPQLANVGYPRACSGGSVKFKTYARGTLYTGVNGYGYIMTDILPGCFNAPSVASVFYSTATFAGTTDSFPGSATPTGGATATMTGSPFAPPLTTTGVNNLNIGVNAYGIRIRSQQPLLTRGGSVKTCALPVVETDIFGFTGSDFLTTYSKNTGWYSLSEASDEWMSMVWSPFLPQGWTAFSSNPGFAQMYQVEGGLVNAANAESDSVTQGILISGTAAGSAFDYEVVGWYEGFGNEAVGNTLNTDCAPDPNGLAVVASVSGRETLNSMQKNMDGAVSSAAVSSGIKQASDMLSGKLNLSDMFKGFMAPTNEVSQTRPVDLPSLQGFSADASSRVSLEELEARWADLALPSVPQPSSLGAADALEELPMLMM